MKLVLRTGAFLLVGGFAFTAVKYAFAYRLLAIQYLNYTESRPNVYTSNTMSQESVADAVSSIRSAKDRIIQTFGNPTAEPTIVFTDTFEECESLGANEFGSVHVGPFHTYVVIGPKGRSPDVIAHELMHAELAHRLGFMDYSLNLPAWLNEGLAAIVDHRVVPSGSICEELGLDYVMNLETLKAFHSVPRSNLIKHYQASKFLASEILKQDGTESLFLKIDRLKNGHTIDSVFKIDNSNQSVDTTAVSAPR